MLWFALNTVKKHVMSNEYMPILSMSDLNEKP